MKTNFLLVILATASLSFLASCGEDEPKPADITFEFAESEVTESDGTIESFHPELIEESTGRVIDVTFVLNRTVPGNVVIKFDVDGTAKQESSSSELNDYTILEEGEGITVNGDEITILKGTKEASLKILVYEDDIFEYEEDDLNDQDVSFETIEFSLVRIVSGPGKLGTANLDHTVRILEDDAVAGLQWEAQDMTPEAAAVDMDMVFWLNGEPRMAASRIGTAFELINVPAGLGEGDFGISYTYYEGQSNDLTFVGYWYNTAGSLDGDRYTFGVDDPLIFGGTYTQANVFPWDIDNLPKIAQTMDKDGIDYSNISGLASFDTGSRKEPLMLKLDSDMLTQLSKESKENSSRWFGKLKK